MLSSTHALYAKRVYDHILKMYNVKLNKRSLIYGSMKPDISSAFTKYPHYINESLDRLSDMVSFMIDTLDTKKELETKSFSRELGVVLHYIADYFCRVHNNINGIPHPHGRKHLKYEKSLQKFIKLCHLAVLDEIVIKDLDFDLKRIDMLSFKDYIIYIHNKYVKEAEKKYLKNESRMEKETDTIYSYEMVLLVASYVVHKVMGKTLLLGK